MLNIIRRIIDWFKHHNLWYETDNQSDSERYFDER